MATLAVRYCEFCVPLLEYTEGARLVEDRNAGFRCFNQLVLDDVNEVDSYMVANVKTAHRLAAIPCECAC